MLKLIVTDLDRTLLRSDKTISVYTAGVLRACQQRGMKVAFATARPVSACMKYADIVMPDAIISNGGAVARAGEQIVYRATMNIETTNKLLLRLTEFPSVGYITVSTENGYLVNKPVDESSPMWADYLPVRCVDMSRGLDCDSYSMAVEILESTTAQAVASGLPDVLMTPFSGEDWYRYGNPEADKWNGVKALAAYAGIDMKCVAAFGDDFNDIEMLKNCGIGVAVKNAIDAVKAAADYICDSNDNDGVAEWLTVNVLCE